MLMAGSVTPQEATKQERTISQLQLKLMAARSTAEERNIRDQVFMAEQARWVTPDVSILKARAHTLVGLDRVERSLSPSSLVLEYVVADPQSYCLAISHSGSRLIPLASREQIDSLVLAYLKAVRAKKPARDEGRRLYDVLLQPIGEVAKAETLVIIPDGPLHLVPLEGLVDGSGDTLSKLTPLLMSRRQTRSIYSHRRGVAPALSHICSWEWAVFRTTRPH